MNIRSAHAVLVLIALNLVISQGSDERAKLDSPTREFAAGMHKDILGNPGVIYSVPTAFMQWVRNGSRLGYQGWHKDRSNNV